MELLTKLFEILTKILSKKDPSQGEEEGLQTNVTKFTITTKKKEEKHIVCNHQLVPIEWDKVITFEDKNGFVSSPGNYKKHPPRRRKPNLFVVHWDGCLSSRDCYTVLEKRGLSAHFCIDNDGTIYQLLDTQDVAWHARGVNSRSIGVEISNAVDMVYESDYDPPRPILENITIHEKRLKPFQGFYPIQIEALKALTKALHKAYDIELKCPIDNGKLVNTIYPDVINNSFKGVVGHYHVSLQKTDPAGLDLEKLLIEVQEEVDNEKV